MNHRGFIICLCDITGKMAEPWINAGYHAVLVDPQHPKGIHTEGNVTRIGGIITEAMEYLGSIIRTGRVVFVFGFPPCTDVAVSGARWFESKRKADPYFQAKAAIVAEQCRTIGAISGARWGWENPVSVFTAIFGKADYTFHPSDYTGFCANDNYTKKTCLRVGGGFVMPEPFKDASLGEPDNRIHFASPGEERANFRSATPMGFARAVFQSNAPHLFELKEAA